MNHLLRFGENVEGYSIPVLNEREIRAAAGMLFLMMFISVMVVILKEDFLLIKYAATIFLADILIRVLVSPRFAPTLILGRLIVRNQVPEYVGAPQKKFAWILGALLASIFFAHLVVVNGYSPISGIICLICLVFLFFEAAFGICLGCKFYSMFYKEKAQYCPGEVCTTEALQDIQKTSLAQVLVVFGFAAFVVGAVLMFNDFYSVKPADIFGINSPAQ
jgi:hypothetical protein